MSDNYIDDVLAGDALWTEIDDYVGRWHDSDDDVLGIEEFLGMTPGEYSLYVEQPRSLRIILAAHKRDESVEDLLAHVDEQAVAARGLDRDDAKKVRSWLQKTGRLPAG